MDPKLVLQREIFGTKINNDNTLLEDELAHYCQKDVRGHFSIVNSIKFSRDETLLASGGVDGRNLIWRVNDMLLERAPEPAITTKRVHNSLINTQSFSNDSEYIYSGGENGYIMKHVVETGSMVSIWYELKGRILYQLTQSKTDDNMMGVAVTDHAFLLDQRCSELMTLDSDVTGTSNYYSIDFHPEDRNLCIITNSTKGFLLFDIRNTLTPLMTKARSEENNGYLIHNTLEAKFSPNGMNIGVIYNYDRPSLFNLATRRLYEFEDQEYISKKTAKTFAFIDDNTIITGSDSFELFWFEAPQDDKKCLPADSIIFEDEIITQRNRKLVGHRSVPNVVAYSPKNKIIASAGFESIVKIWSKQLIPYSYDKPFIRKMVDSYDHSREMEEEQEISYLKELERKKTVEEMEGRATVDDVFSGNPSTKERRFSLELIDMCINNGRFFGQIGFPNYDDLLELRNEFDMEGLDDLEEELSDWNYNE